MMDRLELLELDLDGSLEGIQQNIQNFCKEQVWKISEIRHASLELAKHNPEAFSSHIALQMQALIDNISKFSYSASNDIGRTQGSLSHGVDTVKAQMAETVRGDVHSLNDPAVRDMVWAMTDGHCAYCGTQLTKFKQENSSQNFCIEHVVPRSSGGPDNVANYVPACMGCNSSKGASHVLDFVKSNVKRRIIIAAATKPFVEAAE